MEAGAMMPSRRIARGLIWVAILGVLVLLYLPLIPPLLFSLAPREGSANGASLYWYGQIWGNPVLTGAMVTSLEAGVIVALLTPILALGAAMAVRELRVPRLVLLLVLLPLFLPAVSMGLATAFFLRLLAIAPSLITISLVQILWALPFATLVLLTAMSGFDPVYVEAAHMSGAGRWRAFWDIEFPLIRPGLSAAATFALILSFNETIRTAIVQGPLNTVQTYIWSTYKQVGLSPTLYALMTLLIAITPVLIALSLVGRRTATGFNRSRG
jgi:ABC-type spermidine/putrescine transport system permease subunit II